MKTIASLLIAVLCITNASAQRFDNHKVYLANDGLISSSVNIIPELTFSIKKDNRYSWAKYKIDKDKVTFSATENTTKNNRTCNFVLLDVDGNAVDTLEVIQLGKITTTSNAVGTTTSQAKSSTSTTRRSSTSSSRKTSGGQCAAITKRGTRCSRRAASGSVYCWQHQ